MLAFIENRSGNFGLMLAILLVPVVGVAGLALDYTNASSIKTQVQGAADAAAVASISESSQGVKAALALSGDGEVPIAQSDAVIFFKVQLENETGFIVDSIEANVVKKNGKLYSVIDYVVSVPTTLTRVLGRDTIKVAGSATVEYQTEVYRDFYLLLDNTPSMGVAATPDDVAKMVEHTGCAFACHIVENGVEDMNSFYNIAKNIGVTIRINVVAQAVVALMDTAKEMRKSANQYRMAVYSFGEKAEDTKLFEVIAPTTDLTNAKTKAGEVDLMSIPYQNYDDDQQTNFDRAFTQISESPIQKFFIDRNALPTAA